MIYIYYTYLFVHCVYVWFVMAQQAVLGGGNTSTFFNVSTCYCDVILSSLSRSHSHTHIHTFSQYLSIQYRLVTRRHRGFIAQRASVQRAIGQKGKTTNKAFLNKITFKYWLYTVSTWKNRVMDLKLLKLSL